MLARIATGVVSNTIRATKINNMNTNYNRVIPRDLFNEAKLLKCIGLLVLKIHDGLAPEGLTVYEHDDAPFRIALMDEGALTITSIVFTIGEDTLTFKTTYNSKASYPLRCEYENGEQLVFDEQGNFTNEFLEFCKLFQS